MPESAAVLIRFAVPLRQRAGGIDRVAVSGESVSAALEALERQHPGVLGSLLDPGGGLLPAVRVYLGAADIRMLDGLATRLENDDILFVTFAPADSP